VAAISSHMCILLSWMQATASHFADCLIVCVFCRAGSSLCHFYGGMSGGSWAGASVLALLV
jgi:hypothetical protein